MPDLLVVVDYDPAWPALFAALRAPVADGLNVILIVQLAPAAREPPQLRAGFVVIAKSPGLAPDRATLLTVSALPPLLDRVANWAALVMPTFCP